MTLLVNDPINLRYFTGLEMSAGTLLVDQVLFVDGRYLEQAKASCSVPVELFSWEALVEAAGGTVEIDPVAMSHQKALQLQERLEVMARPHELQRRRMVKRPDEIEKLKRAAGLGSLGFDYACDLLRTGVTEREVARDLEIFWLNQGADGVAFSPTVAFGENSAYPHHRAGDRALREGDVVLLDIGVKLEGYNSDMTRVLFFEGVDEKILKIYEVVQEALVACTARTCGELYTQANEVIEAAGHEFVHSLGHGVGLEVHEAPVLHTRKPWGELSLEPGMVITLEPGIYVAGLGGVRLEDTVLVTESGFENLTNRPLEPLCRRVRSPR